MDEQLMSDHMALASTIMIAEKRNDQKVRFRVETRVNSGKLILHVIRNSRIIKIYHFDDRKVTKKFEKMKEKD